MAQGTALPPIPIFIGYDSRERAATNVLIDSLYQQSSRPLAISFVAVTSVNFGIYAMINMPCFV